MTVTKEFHIRPATPADASTIGAMAIHIWLHTYATRGLSKGAADYLWQCFQPEQIASQMASDQYRFLIGERGRYLLGFAVLHFDAPCPYDATVTTELEKLYVHSHVKAQGLGKQLLLHAETLAMEQTARPLWLSANAQNHAALGFYEHLGYRSSGLINFELEGELHPNHVLLAPANRSGVLAPSV